MLALLALCIKMNSEKKSSSDKSFLVIKVIEVEIAKEVKGVMACDVSPVAMFYLLCKLHAMFINVIGAIWF